MADYADARAQERGPAMAAGSALPIIGRRPAHEQQRILVFMLGLGLIGLILITVLSLLEANRNAAQLEASGQALMQSQRLAKSISQALVGSAQAFPEVRESSEVLVNKVRALRTGSGGIAAAPSAVQDRLETIQPLVDQAEKNAATVLGQQKILTEVGQSLRGINRQSSELLEIAETVLSQKLQRGASPSELSAVGQLVMLTQRIGKSANEFLTMEGVSPEAVFLLGKDLNSFRDIGQGLLDGNAEMRLTAATDTQTRERLTALMTQFEQTR
ncbi:MAG: type IV pili methyl-accepting chemotaxis transducer N-terminal domain-containing protein, partial [Burkholderiaceae bacterium]